MFSSSEAQAAAADLCYAVWRSLPTDYKMRYARNIWEQFQNAIKATAGMTNDLASFYNLFSKRFGCSPASLGGVVLAVVGSDHDEEIMQELRGHYTIVCLRVQEMNDAYNQSRKAEGED